MAELDEKTIEALDELFNAWLALNGVISKEGVLYKADEKGGILYNEQGEEIRMVPEHFKQLINHPVNGFQAFVAKKGLRVNTIQREYPQD